MNRPRADAILHPSSFILRRQQMQTTAKTIPSTLITRIVRGRAALDVLIVLFASAIIAIAAQIAIPIPGTVVPLTMQPLAVLLVGVTLGSARGAAAATLYLL